MNEQRLSTGRVSNGSRREPARRTERLRAAVGRAGALVVVVAGLGLGGCAGVRPEQRAILADPTMVHEDQPLEGEAREHVFENREGAFGGGSVRGGGCGCN